MYGLKAGLIDSKKLVDVACPAEGTPKPVQGRCLHYELDIIV